MPTLHCVRQRDVPTRPLSAEILAVRYRRTKLPGNANPEARTLPALRK